MTQISLSKVYAIIDDERGVLLKRRKMFTKGSHDYVTCSFMLRTLNKLKKEFSHLSDADQLPLGL